MKLHLFGKDLKDPRWIYLKGFLFCLILILSFIGALIDPRIELRFLLLCIVVWSAARSYYFMFYVIEKYVDPSYKFSGIVSFLQYLLSKKK